VLVTSRVLPSFTKNFDSAEGAQARGSMAAVKKAVQAMVTEKRAITADEAKDAMKDLFAGTATQAQTGAFLTSLQVGSCSKCY